MKSEFQLQLIYLTVQLCLCEVIFNLRAVMYVQCPLKELLKFYGVFCMMVKMMFKTLLDQDKYNNLQETLTHGNDQI